MGDLERVGIEQVKISRGKLGEFGYFFDEEGPDGLDGVGMILDQTKIPNGPGSLAAVGELESRTISIPGLAVARSPRELRSMEEKFTGLLWHGGEGKMTLHYPGETFRMQVQRIGGKPQFKPVGELREGKPAHAVFLLQLWARDPVMYGKQNTFGPVGGEVEVPVAHRGNVGVPPVFTISRVSGTVSSYTIFCGPYQYNVTRPLLADHPHTIDMRNEGDLIIDGVTVLGDRGRADTWLIEPGAPQVHRVSVGGGGQIAFTPTVRNGKV